MEKLKVLVLGGSIFLGRAIAEAAVHRGHDVTTFNRGVSHPVQVPGVRHIRGDRYKSIDSLRGIESDLVFDTSCYELEVARSAIDVLGESIGHYTFFSTGSVYANLGHEGNNETSPVVEPYKIGDSKRNANHFAAAKMACELELAHRIPDKTLVIRCGLLVGCQDRSERLPYWVRRIRRGGHVLAPDGRGQAIQFLDVNDLANWAIDLAEKHQIGVFNAVGPESPITLGWLLETCVQLLKPQAELVWVPETALDGLGVRPGDLPLWVPSTERSMSGLFKIDGSKAFAAGLHCRPLSSTVERMVAQEPLPNLRTSWLDPVREVNAV